MASTAPFIVGFYNLLTQFVDSRQIPERTWDARKPFITQTIQNASANPDGPAIFWV